MDDERRTVLRAGGTVAALALAGCTAPSGRAGGGGGGDPAAAVAGEWNGLRSRVDDTLALGGVGAASTGARLARDAFAGFEASTGEWGAHDALERTDADAYERFEEAFGSLRTDGLDAGNLNRATAAADEATAALGDAQATLLGADAGHALDLLRFGAGAHDAATLVADGSRSAAVSTLRGVRGRYDGSAAATAFEGGASDARATFERSLDAVESTARDGDPAATRRAALDALSAAVDGAAALSTRAVAGAGHLAAVRSLALDASWLAGLGGPGRGLVHATALQVLRARAHDAAWSAADGDRGAERVAAVAADFEASAAHDALERADQDAYERFEDGLSTLHAALGEGEADAADALATVDAAVADGVESMAGEAPVLESGYLRARVADARERYGRGERGVAADVVDGVFETFERDELGVHEALERAGEERYHRFESALGRLGDAMRAGDDEGVRVEHGRVRDALRSFAAAAGEEAATGSAETAALVARAFDAAALATPGATERGAAAARDATERFGSGAGGYRDALERADGDAYERFASRLDGVAAAAETGGGRDAASAFGEAALTALASVVDRAGGSNDDEAAAVVADVRDAYASSAVRRRLGEREEGAGAALADALEGFGAALGGGGDVRAARRTLDRAVRRAQFEAVGAPAARPEGDGESDRDADLRGGPNVVEGVPDGADHVVDLDAVAFEPASITVSVGDTVAWTHAAGDAHTVTAVEDALPAGATYWASGGFDSEAAAREGWAADVGAIQSGQSYVHTFETPGEHAYVCIPHEAAGMTGTVTVED